MSMQAPSFKIASAGGGELHCIVVKPEGEPRGMVQFVHGMAEYIERYLPTMERLAQAGYLCFGHDHFGHGHSVTSVTQLGHLDFREGAEHLCADVLSVYRYMQAQYPELQCVLFGHSMGSFVVRAVAAQEPDLYRGVVICGTGGSNPAIGAGKALATVLAAVSGPRKHSPMMYGLMFGGYNKRFPGESAYAWLNSDHVLAGGYEDDPLCGFPFTLGGIRTLLNILGIANNKTHFKRFPKTLPLLLIAGTDDPVGDYGKGVQKVSAQYRAAGVADVTCILYENARHEILNEFCKEKVWDDTLAFLEKTL